MLPNGKYKTANGSTMTIHGVHAGKSAVSFDWLEEDACPDCIPEAYDDDGYMVWRCEVCGGGKAKLLADRENIKGRRLDSKTVSSKPC